MNKEFKTIVEKKVEKFIEFFKGKYILEPVVSEESLIRFEDDFKIKLPENYKWFILNIAGGIRDKDDFGQIIFEKQDFENSFSKEIERNPSKPFPFTSKVIFDLNEEDLITQSTNGQINISDSIFLVVNGKEYGNLWIENIASNNEIFPVTDKENNIDRFTFIQWLLLNLENEIQQEIEEEYIEKTEELTSQNNSLSNQILNKHFELSEKYKRVAKIELRIQKRIDLLMEFIENHFKTERKSFEKLLKEFLQK